MGHKIDFAYEARTDIFTIMHWIHGHDPVAALAWRQSIEDRVDSLRTFPERCPIAPESKNSKHTLRHLIAGKGIGAFRIIYRIQGKTVYILRVQRSAQDYAEDL